MRRDNNNMADITLRQNDKGIDLYFRVKDEDGNSVNVSGATTYFVVGQPGVTTTVISGACTMPSGAETDLLKYEVTGGSTSQVGTYDGELKINFSANQIHTVPNISVRIEGEV